MTARPTPTDGDHDFRFITHKHSHNCRFLVVHASNEAGEQPNEKKIVLFFKTARPKTFQLCSELHRITTVFTGTALVN